MNALYASKLILAGVMFTLLSACSLKDRTTAYGVSVQLPVSTQRTLQNALVIPGMHNLTGAGGASGSTGSTGSSGSLTGLNCFALNVVGTGIGIDSRFGCSKPEQGMGQMTGLAPVAGGTIDAMVPAGTARTIQLIGFSSTVGCPVFGPDKPSKTIMDGLGDPYLLGSTTVDVFADQTINMQAVFDSDKKAFKDCDGGSGSGGGNNGQMSLSFLTINNTNFIQTGACSRVDIQADNYSSSTASAMPAVMPTIVGQTGTGSVYFFTESTCTTMPMATPAAPMNFTAGAPTIPLYVRASAGITDFSLQVATTATGWNLPIVKYTTVNDKLSITMPTGQTYAWPDTDTNSEVSCGVINFARSATGTLGTTDHYNFSVYNNANNNTPAPVEFFYSPAECQSRINQIPAVSSSGNANSLSLDLLFPTTTSQLYFRSPAGVSFSPSINTLSGNLPAEGAISGYTITGALVDYTNSTLPNSVALDGGASTGASIIIKFLNHMGDHIQNVRLGGLDCYVTARTTEQVVCNPPQTGMTPGTFAVEIFPDGVSSFTTLNLSYLNFASGSGTAAFPWTIANVDQFKNIGVYPNSVFQLLSDVDFSSAGASSTPLVSAIFGGVLNGNAHKFVHLSAPLFQSCGAATISNLTLDLVNITSSLSTFGSLCSSSYATLNNVSITGLITLTNAATGTLSGALIGSMSGGTVSHSNSSANLIAVGNSGYVGGLVGQMFNNATVTQSFTTASITTSSWGLVGGIAGGLGPTGNPSLSNSFSISPMTCNGGCDGGGIAGTVQYGTVAQSFYNGTISASNATNAIAGGVVGLLSSPGSVTQSYSSGSVTGYLAGGFVGNATSGTIQNSFSLAAVHGTKVGGFAGTVSSSASVSATYSNPSGLTGTISLGAYSSDLLGTGITNSYAYTPSGVFPGISLVSGVSGVLQLYVDSLSIGYPSLAVAQWHEQQHTSANDLSKTPILAWICAGTYPAADAISKNSFVCSP